MSYLPKWNYCEYCKTRGTKLQVNFVLHFLFSFVFLECPTQRSPRKVLRINRVKVHLLNFEIRFPRKQGFESIDIIPDFWHYSSVQ